MISADYYYVIAHYMLVQCHTAGVARTGKRRLQRTGGLEPRTVQGAHAPRIRCSGEEYITIYVISLPKLVAMNLHVLCVGSSLATVLTHNWDSGSQPSALLQLEAHTNKYG